MTTYFSAKLPQIQTAGLNQLSLCFVDVCDIQTAEGVRETVLHHPFHPSQPSGILNDDT